MSDFDKEAEREKLRQQYESDKEERKSTQRMSELLLQGATMTGKHCDTCGDPIFRYDGNEFCSTCQQAEAQASDTEPNGSESTTETAQSASEMEVESTELDQPRQNQAQQPSQSPQSNQAGNQPPHPTPQQTPPHQSRRAPPSQTTESEHGERPRQAEPRTTGRMQTGSEAGDLSEARNALVRKLTTLSREAESTNDVGYSRELLAATREAAEALAALDRANR